MSSSTKLKIRRLSSTALYLLVVFGGIAYAADSEPKDAGIPWPGPNMGAWTEKFTNLTSGAFATVSTSIGQHGLAVLQGHQFVAAEIHKALTDVSNNRAMHVTYNMSTDTSQTVGSLIKAHESAQRLYSAVNDLSTTLAASIAAEYIDKTPEEAAETVVAVAKEMGYITDADLVSENGKKDPLSLIAKAWAAGDQSDRTWVARTNGKGRPAQCDHITGDYGGSTTPPQTPSQQICTAAIFKAHVKTASVVAEAHAPRPQPDCQQLPGDTCAAGWRRHFNAGEDAADVAFATIDPTIQNATFQGETGASNILPSFFITKAYAADKQTRNQVMARKQDAASAAQQTCQDMQAIHRAPMCSGGGGSSENSFFVSPAYAGGSGDISGFEARHVDAYMSGDQATNDVPGMRSDDLFGMVMHYVDVERDAF